MPANFFTKKANTPAKKRQWSHVEDSMLSRGASRGAAVRAANAVVRDHPAKAKPKSGHKPIHNLGHYAHPKKKR